jgi:hypothetical protein
MKADAGLKESANIAAPARTPIEAPVGICIGFTLLCIVVIRRRISPSDRCDRFGFYLLGDDSLANR